MVKKLALSHLAVIFVAIFLLSGLIGCATPSQNTTPASSSEQRPPETTPSHDEASVTGLPQPVSEEIDKDGHIHYVYTGLPSRMDTPENLVATYVFLCDKGDFETADTLCTESWIRYNGKSRWLWPKLSRGIPLMELTVIIMGGSESLDSAMFECTYLFEDAEKFYGGWCTVVKDDGKWKLE